MSDHFHGPLDEGPCACGRFKSYPRNIPPLTDGTFHLMASDPPALCEVSALRAKLAAAGAEVQRLKTRLSTRETARGVALHRVYQAADEILGYLPVPGWEHSAEATGAYERLLRGVREVKRLVKRKRRMKEKRARAQPGSGEGRP